MIKLLLASKADLKAATKPLGYTPLHCAAQQGHIDVARLLLKRGMDVNAHDSDQGTPLHNAALYGQVKMIRFLLENKADIQAANEDKSPLLAACMVGKLEAIRVLLDHKADVNVREKYYGRTPLHHAVAGEDPAVVRLLLDHGALVDTVDSWGLTPLHLAACRGNVQAARLLLDYNANVRAALKDTGEEPLHEAAAYSSAKMVALLLDRGADINARQKNNGWTPLHRAIEADREGSSQRAVIALLKRKADYTIKDKDGLTPLAFAVKKDCTKIIQLLRTHGAKE
jgi:serine/threonine-protein phosphatase 6 regulatory ankyrin repeat subunit B